MSAFPELLSSCGPAQLSRPSRPGLRPRLALALGLLLSACAKPSPPPTDPGPPPPTPECDAEHSCASGLVCTDLVCGPCSEASACNTGVCNASGRCEEALCELDDDCPIDEICDGGQCLYLPLGGAPDQPDPPDLCGVSAIYFGFDSAKLSPNNQDLLQGLAPCLAEQLERGGTLVLEAHADKIGSEEFNLLLSDRRGATVLTFLVGLGLPEAQLRVVGKGALEAVGEDQQAQAKHRRVTFILE